MNMEKKHKKKSKIGISLFKRKTMMKAMTSKTYTVPFIRFKLLSLFANFFKISRC